MRFIVPFAHVLPFLGEVVVVQHLIRRLWGLKGLPRPRVRPFGFHLLLDIPQVYIHILPNTCKNCVSSKPLAGNECWEGLQTYRLELPHVGLHTDTIVLIFPKECEPKLHRIGLSILYLDQAPHGNPFKILLTFFEYKITSWDCPPLYNPWQWDWPWSRQIEIVCSPQSKVRKKFNVSDTVRSELEIARGYAILRHPFQRLQIDSL